METPQTTNFSRKCRDKVNTHFANLRKILTPYFADAADWNRFKIIERALVLLGAKKSENFENYQAGQKSNKEACALYRSKLNRAFEELKETLISRNLVNLREYRLFTRAGILDCAISSLQVIQQNTARNPGVSPIPVLLPRPIISRKRSAEEFSIPQPKFLRTPNSTGSISPCSDSTGSISPVDFTSLSFGQSALARIRTLAFLKMASQNSVPIFDNNVCPPTSSIWRPW